MFSPGISRRFYWGSLKDFFLFELAESCYLDHFQTIMCLRPGLNMKEKAFLSSKFTCSPASYWLSNCLLLKQYDAGELFVWKYDFFIGKMKKGKVLEA